MAAPSTTAGAWFQAPTCGSLGLDLEIRLRNTARVHGSGERQKAADRVPVELRAYRRGELAYANTSFGEIPPSGTLVVREADLPLSPRGPLADGDEFLLLARLHTSGSQEHHLVYTHPRSRAQAHILYDQQPVRPRDAAAAPIVFLMPKVWIGDEVTTHVVVANSWDVPVPTLQPRPVRFSLLDQQGQEVAAWEHTFFYNEARAFDLGERVPSSLKDKSGTRFFNLIGRGGASSFVLFAIVRNLTSNHFAVEHSLPPIYYMDGAMAPVRAQGCDARLFERGAGQ